MAKTNLYVSFHYQNDSARVQQVLNMGVVEGQQIVTAQRWEQVKARGDKAIENWIDVEMKGKSALLVLVGTHTAKRRWVRHEIVKAWNAGMPVVGVRIHNLKDLSSTTSVAGPNPFDINMSDGVNKLSKFIDLHNPAGATSQAVHATIASNLASWVGNANRRN